MEKFTQSGNVHYDNMAKQLSALNDLMSKLVGQVCQPTMPIGSHFQTRAIVGHISPHNSLGLNPGPGLETFFGPSTSNQGVSGGPNLNGDNVTTNLGGNPIIRDNVLNGGHNLPRVNEGVNTQYNGYNGLNNGTFPIKDQTSGRLK